MFQIIIYLFFLISFLVLMKMKWRFIFFLSLFNLLADMSFTFFQGFSAPTIMRAAINFIFLLYAAKGLYTVKIRNYFYLFFAFVLIMLIFSQTFIFSVRVTAQVIMSMGMFLVGYAVFKNIEEFSNLLNDLKPIIYVALIATAIGYIFNIGRSLEYTVDKINKADAENVGLLGSGGMYVPGIVLGLLPLLLRTHKRLIGKLMLIGAASVLYLLILLNVRRTAILIPIMGLFGFFVYMPSKLKLRIFKYVFIVAIALLLAYPLYSKILNRRYKIRESSGRFEKGFYKTEPRYLEYFQMFDAIQNFDDPLKVLFGAGNNLFVDTNAYGIQTTRMIHSDIPKIFYSLGLVGLFLYFLVYLSILREIISIPAIGDLKDIKAACLGLFFISILVSLNGSITLFSFRALNFLLLGSFLGYSRRLMYSYGEFFADQKA